MYTRCCISKQILLRSETDLEKFMEKIEIKITLSEEELQEAWAVVRDIQSTLQEINNKLDELQLKDK
jgi:hypothetical protein